MNYITDKEIDAIQGDMGETLRKQPRVRMRIEGSGRFSLLSAAYTVEQNSEK